MLRQVNEMGQKPVSDNLEQRLMKAFILAWEENHIAYDDTEIFTNPFGYTKIICLPTFIVYDAMFKSNRVFDEQKGLFRGIIHGAKVYTDQWDNRKTIELRDTKGQFTYIIDLSSE